MPSLIGFRDIRDLSRILDELTRESHACIISAQPKPEFYTGERVYRRYKKQPQIYDLARRAWTMLDVDKIPLPSHLHLAADPIAVIHWVLEQLAIFLPGFRGTTCHVQLSNSAGLSSVPGAKGYGAGGFERVSMHIWIVLDRGYSHLELKRWAAAANAHWQGGGGIGPLIDLTPIRNPIQPCYTADPIIDGFPNPVAQRSFLMKRERDCATPVIPDAHTLTAIEKAAGVHEERAAHDIAYAAALDRIGDYSLGKNGFYWPLLDACRAAVTEQGAQLDAASVVADIAKRVVTHRGPRSDEQIARYSSEGYLLGMLSHYQERRATREAETAVRSERARRQQRPGLTLAEGEREIAEAARHAVARCISFIRSRELLAQGREAGLTSKEARAEACRQLGLKRYPQRRPVIVINATLGLGKTRAMLEAIRDALNALPAPVSVDWYAPSYSLLEPTVSRFAGMECKVPHRVIRGRSQPDPEKRIERVLGGLARGRTDLMCGYARGAEAVGAVGKSVSQTLCSECVLQYSCGYFNQFADERAHVNFMPHARLKSERPTKLPQAAFAVIDENPCGEALTDRILGTGALLSDMRVLGLLGGFATPEQAAAMFKAINWLRGLLWWGWRTAHAPMAEIVPVLEFVRGRGVDKVSVVDGDDTIVANMRRFLANDRYAMHQLLEQLVRCHQQGVELRDTIQMTADQQSLRMARFDWLKISDRQPVIILDATADYDMIAALFGRDIEWIDIDVKQNLHITQIDGLTGSKSSLFDYNATTPKQYLTPDHANARTKKLAEIVDTIAKRAGGRRTLLITQKETAGYLAGMLPPNFELRHFGDLRGHNDHEGVAFVVVFGRQLAPLRDLERHRTAMLAAIGNDPMTPFCSTKSYAER